MLHREDLRRARTADTADSVRLAVSATTTQVTPRRERSPRSHSRRPANVTTYVTTTECH